MLVATPIPDAHPDDSRASRRGGDGPFEYAEAQQSDHSSDNNADDSPRLLSPSTDDNYQVRAGDLGAGTSSHRRGHWFDPSIAHQRKRPLPIVEGGV
jgi:hypothetical protein